MSNVYGGSLSYGRRITVTPPLPFITPTKISVFRSLTHIFCVRSAAYLTTPLGVINWGASTDLPVTGDWNADGMFNLPWNGAVSHVARCGMMGSASISTYDMQVNENRYGDRTTRFLPIKLKNKNVFTI